MWVTRVSLFTTNACTTKLTNRLKSTVALYDDIKDNITSLKCGWKWTIIFFKRVLFSVVFKTSLLLKKWRIRNQIANVWKPWKNALVSSSNSNHCPQLAYAPPEVAEYKISWFSYISHCGKGKIGHFHTVKHYALILENRITFVQWSVSFPALKSFWERYDFYHCRNLLSHETCAVFQWNHEGTRLHSEHWRKYHSSP